MPQVLDWQLSSDRRAVIDQAVDALHAGQLVVFPTDTSYRVAASVLCPETVERLARLRTTQPGPLLLALPSAAHALDWAPTLSPLARRLARRCWPGPVAFQVDEGVEYGLASRLAESVRQRVAAAGTLSLYVPGHDALAATLLLLPAPLVLDGAGPSSAVTVQQLLHDVGDDVALIVADGPSRSTQAISMVRVSGATWTVVQEGVVSAEELALRTTRVILFVCTGNTCRSPMAAALCRQLLAGRLKCPADQLPRHGYSVLSAGMAAMPGDCATPEAVAAMAELGADLNGHTSQPLSAELLVQADHLLTMTRGHQLALVQRFARYGPEPQLLDPEGNDITDPVGFDQEVYRECARQIRRYLERFVAELPIDRKP